MILRTDAQSGFAFQRMVLHRLELYVLAVNHGGRLYVDFHCLADAESGL